MPYHTDHIEMVSLHCVFADAQLTLIYVQMLYYTGHTETAFHHYAF